MAYFAPYIDSTGFHMPTFLDIQNYLVTQAQAIFGSGIYLDNDSQDLQYIAAVSKAAYDAMQIAESVYNNQSPQTASGVGLDGIVKINGLQRASATYSTCLVTCVGTAGTFIPAGIVRDTSNQNWLLPVNTTIPVGGVLSVLVTAEYSGAVVADIGAIQTIATPLYGWTSVSNAVAATPGMSTETDISLRTRQALSVSLPSATILEGIIASILDTPNVTRAVGYANNTSGVDSNGVPAYSLSMVVEGGADADIAHQIYLKKTPGVPTYGTTSVNETDANGFVTPINFFRPTVEPIDVSITVKGLTGYTSAIGDSIKSNVAAYLNSLQIGSDVYISSLWGAALSALPDARIPAFSITALTAAVHGGTLGTTDIAIAFNAVSHGVSSYVTVAVT